jgi:hypothetical protein
MDKLGLGELIIESGRLDSKVEEIVNEATNTGNLVGDSLWRTLVFSGIQLGIDSVKSHFMAFGASQLNYLRSVIKTINERLPYLSGDDDTFKAMTEIRDKLTGSLREHCKVVTDAHVDSMKSLYAIPEKYVTATSPLDDIPKKEFQRIGFFAMNRAPMYFFAWELADRDGSLSTLKCTCSECLIKKLSGPINPSKELNAAIERIGGIDEVLAKYGRFLIDGARDGLNRISEGVDDIHSTLDEKAIDSIMADAMKFLKPTRKESDDT